jgi:hypothetical protein
MYSVEKQYLMGVCELEDELSGVIMYEYFGKQQTFHVEGEIG